MYISLAIIHWDLHDRYIEYCENRLSVRVHLQENVGGFLKNSCTLNRTVQDQDRKTCRRGQITLFLC